MTSKPTIADTRESVRQLSSADRRGFVPVQVVWELTFACNLKCMHCGSRAGHRRPSELGTEECLDIIDQLAKLGMREISIIGGEAFIRKDWLTIIHAITARGMTCSMQTGGYKLSNAMIDAVCHAGLIGLGVSIDGLEDLHDDLRGVSGSYLETLRVLEHCLQIGLPASVNTQITSRTIPQLSQLMDVIITAGVRYWQLQLTVAMGNAVDNDEILLQPYELAALMPLIARLHAVGRERGLMLLPGNNLGYFDPYESLWQGMGQGRYRGCAAGANVVGIEADGTLKGCPSLATARYAAGNVRDKPVAELWAEADALQFFNRGGNISPLWGFCRTCEHADKCRGGCTWTADSLLGRRGNNPYCHHRVLRLVERGRRERIVKIQDAAKEPFGTGRFALIEELIDASHESAASALHLMGSRLSGD